MKVEGQVRELGQSQTIKKVIKTIFHQCTLFKTIIKKKIRKAFKLRI
jgi:hypothetical protein